MKALLRVDILEGSTADGAKVSVQIPTAGAFFVPRDQMVFLVDGVVPTQLTEGELGDGDLVLLRGKVVCRSTKLESFGTLLILVEGAGSNEPLIHIPVEQIGVSVLPLERAVRICKNCVHFYPDNQRATCGRIGSISNQPTEQTLANGCSKYER